MRMRTTSLLIVLAALLRAASMQAQAPSWINAWSFPAQGTEQPTAADADAAGNVYVTTYLLDFMAEEPADMVKQFLISSAPDGAQRWSRTFIAGTLSRRGAMDVDDAGNIYVAATFGGESVAIDRGESFDTLTFESDKHILLAKYDNNGALLWRQVITGSDSLHVTSVAATAGGFWIGGSFTGTVDFGETRLTSAGRGDAFIAMADSTGSFRRAIRAGGSSTDECDKIAVDRNGDIVMLGLFRGTATFGEQTLTASGRGNFFLARYRADGALVWANADGGAALTLASTFTPYPMQLELDRDGNAYVAISYLGTISINGNPFPSESESDGVLIKYSPDGVGAWAVFLAGDLLQLVGGIATDTDGSIFVSGFSQVIPGGTFLTKLSSNGDGLWQTNNVAVPPLSGSEGGPVCIDAMHNVYVAGHFDGTVRFGNRTLSCFGSTDTSIMGTDVFIAKIGSTSSVSEDRVASLHSVVVRDGEIIVAPSADVVEAGAYSILGERVASPAPGVEEEIRFDVGGVAQGVYVVVVRTVEGVRSYRVVVGR